MLRKQQYCNGFHRNDSVAIVCSVRYGEAYNAMTHERRTLPRLFLKAHEFDAFAVVNS